MKQTIKTSRAAGQLEKMFRELNKHYFAGKLPEPIINLFQGLAGRRREQVRDQHFVCHARPSHRRNRRNTASRDGARVLHGDQHQGH